MASAVNDRNDHPTPVQAGTPTTADAANDRSKQEPKDIPRLTHIIPTIFVPLTENLLEPIEPPKDRVEHLERMVASLDANERWVRHNIAWTYEREARRYVAAARETGGETGALSASDQPRLMSWEEAERHVARMAAQPKPTLNYHLPPEKIAEFKAYDQSCIDVVLPNDLTPHERISREILHIVNRGVRDMEGYSNYHIKGIRDRHNASLEHEKQASAAFDRPRS